jgi:hypothetical protein
MVGKRDYKKSPHSPRSTSPCETLCQLALTMAILAQRNNKPQKNQFAKLVDY